jgi:hypothetical protein
MVLTVVLLTFVLTNERIHSRGFCSLVKPREIRQGANFTERPFHRVALVFFFVVLEQYILLAGESFSYSLERRKSRARARPDMASR